ncbi:MAG: enoyl-CoA hydratase/isomerase family protein [Chloroflexi bacterium]|nr:enoyl-CoA hydratase/isomerase family protein [Chloroflexota bacterium]
MPIEYQKDGKIAIFTVNRPETRNALNVQDLRDLGARMQEFRDDPEAWVGIITGSGDKAFCSGADIREMLPFMKQNVVEAPWKIPATSMGRLELWKPLIAAVNGVALGGGLELTVSCDIRIAAENARFGVPEIRLGLIPGWGGTQRLPRMVPWCKAAELLLMGRPIDAAEAYRIGLVNLVVPGDKLMDTAREWAQVICECGPLAVRGAKEAMVRGSEMSLEEGLRVENLIEGFLQRTEDFEEGTKAFVEKRKPVWKGK